MWELMTGERPQRGQLRMPRVPQECSQADCDLLLRCMAQDPAARPSAAEVLAELSALTR